MMLLMRNGCCVKLVEGLSEVEVVRRREDPEEISVRWLLLSTNGERPII